MILFRFVLCILSESDTRSKAGLSLGLTKLCLSENLWNAFPSIRTTIQHSGKSRSSVSNFLTYSYLLWDMAMFRLKFLLKLKLWKRLKTLSITNKFELFSILINNMWILTLDVCGWKVTGYRALIKQYGVHIKSSKIWVRITFSINGFDLI